MVKRKGKKAKKLSLKEKQNRQVIWAVVLMLSVIAIIFIVPFIMKNFINKFVYVGFDFYKTKAGDFFFYTTKIPLVNSYGFPIGDYQISFRNDPRELEDIEVDIIDNKISFEKEEIVYISIESEAPICDDNIIAVVGLTNFLDKFGNLKVKGAMHDVYYTSGNDLVYVTCDNHPDNTILLVKTGNETEIKKTGKNCYELIYKDCEINRAAEKFIITILEGYMEKYMEFYGDK